MPSIDERITRMKFENGDFQKRIGDTLSALDKLKEKLNFSGSRKGLDEVAAASKNVKFDNMHQGIDGLASKFSALQIAGVAAFATIVSKATDAGLQLANSLSLGPITQGFQEYELKMGSIQTILANTARHGTGLDVVNAELDALNEYSDKTIYNFAEMTKNASLFTNSGMKIEDATTVIKGFSNAAAASGTSAEGAAGAAYQLSQALSAGTIRLMDWRSLTNVGMGGKNMQEGVIELAQAMGTFEGTGIDATGAAANFNQSLEKGWLSADVMSNYLKIMSGDMTDAEMSALGLSDATVEMLRQQATMGMEAATKVRTFSQLMGTIKESIASGWSETFEIIFGDFEQATELFTGISDSVGGFIGRMSDARNAMLTTWADAGGRTAVIEGLKNVFQAFGKILGPIGKAFRAVFPPNGANILISLSKAFEAFTEKLIISDGTSKAIQKTFEGIFSVLKFGIGIIAGVIEYVVKGALIFAQIGGQVVKLALNITGAIGNLISTAMKWIESTGAIQNLFDTIIEGRAAMMGPLLDFLGKFTDALGALLSGDFSGFKAGMSEAFSSFGNFVDLLKSHGAALKESISEAFDAIGEKLSEFANNARAKGHEFVAVVADIASTVSNFFSNLASGAFGSVSEAIGNLSEKFGDLSESLNIGSEFQSMSAGANNAAGSLGGLRVVGEVLKSIWEGVGNAVSGVTSRIQPILSNVLEIIETITSKIAEYLKGMDGQEMVALLNTGFFIALYIALKRFVGNLKGLVDNVGEMVDNIGGVFGTLTDTLKTMQQNVKANIILKIAVAVGILVAALYLLSEMDSDKLKQGLIGLGIVLGLLAATLMLITNYGIPDTGKVTATGTMLVLLAIAIKILASAVEDLSKLSWEEMIKGLVAVGALLAALTLFSKFAEADKGGVKAGIGLILLATAIRILVDAVATLGAMDTGSLIKGITALGVMVAMLAAMVIVMNGVVGLPAAAVGLLILAAALAALTASVLLYSTINWTTLLDGLAKMAIALVAIGISARALPTNLPITAAGLVILSGALVVIAGVLTTLGLLDWGTIVKGLVALGGAMLIIAVGANAMTGTLKGSAAMVVMAIALGMLVPILITLGMLPWEVVVGGLVALAGIFAVLGVAGLVLAPVVPVIMSLGIAIAALGAGLMLAGAGFALFAVGFATLAALGTAGFAVLIAGFEGLLNLIPLFAQQIAYGLIAFAKVITDAGPVLVDAMVVIIMSLLKAVDRTFPKVVDTLAKGILAMSDKMVQLIPRLAENGLRMLIGILTAIKNNMYQITRLGGDIVVEFLNGVASNMERTVEAGVRVVIAFINGLANAIRANQGQMEAAGGNLARAIVSGMASGIANGGGAIKTAAVNLAKNALNAAKDFLGINSPSKKFIEIGMGVDEGFALGIDRYSGLVEKSTEDVGSTAIDQMKTTIMKIGDVLTTDVDFNPTIAPVLDLDKFKRDAGLMTGLLGVNSIKPEVSFGQASNISSDRQAARDAELTDITASKETPILKFEQNNYSPEALSALDIYRNTNNQLSQAAKALGVSKTQ